MGHYIFTFIFGFMVLSLYDKFFSRRQPHDWLVRWRENMTIAVLATLVSLILNMIMDR